MRGTGAYKASVQCSPCFLSPNAFQVHRGIALFPSAQWESFLTYFTSFCSHSLPPVTHVQLCSQETHCLSLKTFVPKTFISPSLLYLKNLCPLLVWIIHNLFKMLERNSSRCHDISFFLKILVFLDSLPNPIKNLRLWFYCFPDSGVPILPHLIPLWQLCFCNI